jgi:hypothetical protein
LDDVSAPFVERPVIDMFGRASFLEREDEVVGISRTPQSPRFDTEDQRLSILQADFVGDCSAVADLAPAEKAAARRRLRKFEPALDVQLAQLAVGEHRLDARERCLRVARTRGHQGMTRLEADLSAALPSLAGKAARLHSPA